MNIIMSKGMIKFNIIIYEKSKNFEDWFLYFLQKECWMHSFFNKKYLNIKKYK